MYRNAKQDYEPVQKNSTEEVKKDLKEKNPTFSPPYWCHCDVLTSLHPTFSASDILKSCCGCGVCFSLLPHGSQCPLPHSRHRSVLRRTPHPWGNPSLLRWKEQDVPPSVLQTSVFSKLLTTWFEICFPHILMTIHRPPVMPGKTSLFSAESGAEVHTRSRTHGSVSDTAGAEQMCSQWTGTEASHNLCAVCNPWPVLQPPFSVLKGFSWNNSPALVSWRV